MALEHRAQQLLARTTKGSLSPIQLQMPSVEFACRQWTYEAKKQQKAPETTLEKTTEHAYKKTAEQALEYIAQLEQALNNSQAQLHNTVLALGIVNEKLQTANQELTVTNSVLEQTNGELQTVNEQLHAVNEELRIINVEYQSKIQALIELNNDLDNLINSSDIGVVYLDNALKVRKFTPAATQVFQLVNADIGRPLHHLAHSLEMTEENTDIRALLRQAKRQHQPLKREVKLKNGGPYLLLQVFPYINEHKVTDGLILTLVNVNEMKVTQNKLAAATRQLSIRSAALSATNQRLETEVAERIQAQVQLDHRARLLERSNGDLEQFAYVVSHDLKEPLRAMTIFSQLLQQQYQSLFDPKAAGYIEHIVEGGIRMQALIDGILSFSRVSDRTQHFQPVALGPLLDTVCNNLSASITQSNATITFDMLPTISGDPQQISQLFQNLISNAIKFKATTAPVIHISATAQLTDVLPTVSPTNLPADSSPAASTVSKRWTFSVQDNGIGISEEQQDRIFSLFQRLHTRQEIEGYGIGLAICKKIVERHHGRIWVKSRPGKGSAFYFTLADCSEQPAQNNPFKTHTHT